MRGEALGGFERTEDQTGTGMPVAQTREKHPERENTAGRPARRIFCTLRQKQGMQPNGEADPASLLP